MQKKTADLTDRFDQFFRKYYHQDILELAHGYPSEQTMLFIQYDKLFQFDEDLAEDWIEKPDQIRGYADEALRLYDIPVDVKLGGASVRLIGLDEEVQKNPGDLTKEDGGKYRAIKGDLARVTTSDDYPTEIAYECQRCGTMTYLPQNPGSKRQSPYECQGCERQGPFHIDETQCAWEDYCRLRVETPPDISDSSYIDGYVTGDLVHYGDESGLLGRAGERATVYGVIERKEKSDDSLLFERVLRVEAIEFDSDDDTIDIEKHLPAIRELAAEPDAVDKFAESLVPELYVTEEWNAALELAVAYLFAAPRVSIENGPTYRGDIHVLIISDFGMGKSSFNRAIEMYSPKCVHKSATALSSDVGLLAAAVRDDFGDGQWTIKPGIIVRANGGHVILDEIDKPDVDLTMMNDALEGSQRVDVEKAGQSATYNSRIGLMATGNPTGGMFDKYEPIAPQLGLKPSFLSRFDGIVTMEDTPDPEQDGAIAETAGLSYVEADEAEHGDRDEFEQLHRPVPVDVGQAWIAYAREEINPLLQKQHVQQIKEWYAEEARQLNEGFGDEGEGRDMPVPTSTRVVLATIRFSKAFARVKLRDTVATEDVERAMNLSKRLIAQNWDGEKFDGNKNISEGKKNWSQDDRIDEMVRIVGEIEGEDPAEENEVIDMAVSRGMKEKNARETLDILFKKGLVYEPRTGTVRVS